MTKKRKVKINFGRFIFFILLVGLVIYTTSRFIYANFFSDQIVYTAKYDILTIESEYNVVAFRDEILVTTRTSGNVEYFVDEGGLVDKGMNVLEISNDGDETIETNSSDDIINQDDVRIDYNKLGSDIEEIENEIVYWIGKENYQYVSDLSKDLKLKLETKDKLEGENKFLANRSFSSLEKSVGDVTLLEGQSIIIDSPGTGIISYILDGYEDMVKIENIYDTDYSLINESLYEPLSLKGDTVDRDNYIFKVLDNSTIYLAIIIELDEIDFYKDVDKLTIRLNSIEASGYVKDVFASNDVGVILFQTHEKIDEIYEKRIFKCDVIQNQYQGINIFGDSIVYEDGNPGVYRVDDTKKLEFVPINIIATDGNKSVVYNSKFYDSDRGLVYTVSSGDEIIRNGNQHSVGESIIN